MGQTPHKLSLSASASFSYPKTLHIADKSPTMQFTTDQVILGDCHSVLHDWHDHVVDLVYLDPPFNTGRSHTANNGAYKDTWPNLGAYLAFMHLRLQDICRVLKPNGTILLHCDWRTSHHLRLMLDSFFGEENFVNHLIWSYGLGGSSPRRFARKHDDILFYSKSDAYFFKPPMVPATSNRMKGQLKKATDIIEIPALNNMAHERLGYPTQKPVALLELLIKACSPSDAIVLDPMCGSGTTLVAAKNLGRQFVGIDANPEAVELVNDRLEDYAKSKSYSLAPAI